MYLIRYFIGLTVFSTVFYSCVPLKHVNEYASSSVRGLKQIEDLDLDYSKACMERCKLDNLYLLRLEYDSCDCSNYGKADSVAFLIYNAISVYFKGLASISDNELISYNTENLSTALTENEFGNIRLQKEQVEAYSEISAIVLNALTNEYRKNKIRIYINEADEAIGVLLDYLVLIEKENLGGLINIMRLKLERIFSDILDNSTNSDFDKKLALMIYFEKVMEINNWEKELGAYSKTLLKIKAGHKELAKNVDQLKNDEVKTALIEYARDIEAIRSKINNLK